MPSRTTFAQKFYRTQADLDELSPSERHEYKINDQVGKVLDRVKQI